MITYHGTQEELDWLRKGYTKVMLHGDGSEIFGPVTIPAMAIEIDSGDLDCTAPYQGSKIGGEAGLLQAEPLALGGERFALQMLTRQIRQVEPRTMTAAQVFKLTGDPDKYRGFLQVYTEDKPEDMWKQTMAGRCIRQGSRPFGESYSPLSLELDDAGKKKKPMGDLSAWLMPFMVLSSHARGALQDLLGSRGEFLEVIAPLPGYMGYRVLRCIDRSVDMERSVSTTYDNGAVVVRKPTFYENKIQDEHLFMIPEAPTSIFVSSLFKELVVASKLKGFEFREMTVI